MVGACFIGLLSVITVIDMIYRALARAHAHTHAHEHIHTHAHTRILQQVLASCSTMACCEDSGFAARCQL